MSVLVVPETEREVADSIYGVGANLKLPGYEPCSFAAEAPLARGDCAELVVTLIPSAVGLGSVKIHFTNFPTITEKDLRTFATSRLFGVVILNDRRGSSFTIAVRLDCGGEVALDEVPAGTYRVWFRDTFEFLRSPALGEELTHEVLAGSESSLTFDLPPHGQIVLFSDDGAAPRGLPLGLGLSCLRDGQVIEARQTPYFTHLPGALFFLPEGVYRLESRSCRLGPEQVGDLRVHVVQGERIALPVFRTGR
jgi:hypothetical protein